MLSTPAQTALKVTLPGLALSGILCPKPWGEPWQITLDRVIQLGLTHVSLPFWLSQTASYADAFGLMVQSLHRAGIAVHAVPHVDGPSMALNQLPVTDPGAYAGLCGPFVEPLGPDDSFEWWNEVSPAAGWPGNEALYATTGALLHAAIKARGVRSVAPIPMAQTAEDALNALSAQLWNTQWGPAPDAYSAHVYKADLTTPTARLQTLAGQFEALDAFAFVLGVPIVVTEFGGTTGPTPTASPASASAQPQPDAAFYASVAAACAARGWIGYAWQAWDPGDGLGVLGTAAVMDALGYAAPQPAAAS